MGAARFLNVPAAQAAIATTLAACGAFSVTNAAQAGGCPGLHPAAAGTPAGAATIEDFASNGLDSGNQFLQGQAASFRGGVPAAFGGANPNVGLGKFILPVGRSGYDALEIVIRQQVTHPAPGIASANFQASYSLSEIVNPIKSTNTGDQFFASSPYNYDNPNLNLGRSNLDHTNELSFGGAIQVKYGLNVGVIGHFFSAAATSLVLDNTSQQSGEIFRTDIDGDGQTGDLLPNTNPGFYGHQIKGAGLNQVINNYNATNGGQLTPAGQALVSAGLVRASDLVALGGAQVPIATAPTTPINNPLFRAFDASVGYPISLKRLHEGISLEPKVAMYNVANLSNFNQPGLTGVLANINTAGGTVGQRNSFLNGPNNESVYNGIRTQRGSGTFAQGSPRTTEFQLHLNF